MRTNDCWLPEEIGPTTNRRRPTILSIISAIGLFFCDLHPHSPNCMGHVPQDVHFPRPGESDSYVVGVSFC